MPSCLDAQLNFRLDGEWEIPALRSEQALVPSQLQQPQHPGGTGLGMPWFMSCCEEVVAMLLLCPAQLWTVCDVIIGVLLCAELYDSSTLPSLGFIAI